MERSELAGVNGVTVTGPTRISSKNGTFCWTSGPFLTIVEAAKGLDQAEFVSVKKTISCLALSPDKSRLVTGEAGKDPCVRVWCRDVKKYTAKFKGHRFEIVNVAWHPEGRHVLSCGDQHDRQINMWCLRTNSKVATSRLQQQPTFSLFFDSKTLITIGKGLIRFWTTPSLSPRTSVQMMTGRNAALKQRRESTFIDACATSTNIYVVAHDGIAKLSSTRSLQSWCDYTNCKCISTNGELLFVGIEAEYGGCVVVMTQKFDGLCELALGDISLPPNPVAIAPVKGEEVFVVYSDRSCTLWDCQKDSPKILEEYAGIRGPVNSIITAGPQLVMTGSTDGTSRVWQLGQKDIFQVGIHSTINDSSVRVMALDELRERLAVGCANGNLELYRKKLDEVTEESCWEFVKSIEAHDSEVTTISWHNDMLATGGRDRFVHVIFVEGNQRPLTVDYHTSSVTAVNWIQDEAGNAKLVTGGTDKALFFLAYTEETLDREKWIKTSSSISDIRGRRHAFVAHGKHVASYDLSGEQLNKYESEKWTKNLVSICLDDNEQYLAASCQVNVAVFEVSRGQVLVTVPVQAISICLVTGSGSLPTLVAGDSEGTISMWALVTRNIHRTNSLPLPTVAEDAKPAKQTFAEKNARRRSQWNSMPTPFKIKSALDCSAVTIFDEDEENDQEDDDHEVTDIADITEEETVLATNNSTPEIDSNESIETMFASCMSTEVLFPECPVYADDSRLSLSTHAINRLSSNIEPVTTIEEETMVDARTPDKSTSGVSSVSSSPRDKSNLTTLVDGWRTRLELASEEEVAAATKELLMLSSKITYRLAETIKP